jgi:hypothetical protein
MHHKPLPRARTHPNARAAEDSLVAPVKPADSNRIWRERLFGIFLAVVLLLVSLRIAWAIHDAKSGTASATTQPEP